MFKKVILYGLLVFIVIAVALFSVDGDITATKKSFFKTSSLELMDQIVDLEKFNQWDPRAKTDTSYIIEYEGNPGLGMRSITKVASGKVISEYKVAAIEPLRSVDIEVLLAGDTKLTYEFLIEHQSNGVELTWTVNFEGPLFLKLIDIEADLAKEFEKAFGVLRARVQD